MEEQKFKKVQYTFFTALKNIQLKKAKRYIKPIAIIGCILLCVFIGYQMIILTTNNSVHYWYRDHPVMKFSSYSKPYYGIFVAKMRAYFACDNKDVFEELDEKRFQITHLIRQLVSDQNYYQINTEVKRNYNLSPLIIRKLNSILHSGRIVDVFYAEFFLVKDSQKKKEKYQNYFYLDLGSHELLINKKTYYFEFYIIVDATPPRFFDALVKNSNQLKELIVNHLYMNRHRYENQNILIKAKEVIHEMLSKKASDFIGLLGQNLKQRHPLLVSKNYYVDSLFGIFLQKKDIL